MSGRKLLVLATEDWFVRSHFMPLLQRAQAEGFEVVVAARDSGALDGIAGVRLIDTPFSRGSLKPWDTGRQVAHLRELLERERPDIVHAIALKPIVLLILSRYRDCGRVLAVTGRGYLGISSSLLARFVRARLKRMVGNTMRQPRTLLLVENSADLAWLQGGPELEQRALLMPGAGVDREIYAPTPEPTQGPIVVGLAARLVRSKGIDLAVAAVGLLREQGHDVVLRIAGAVDADNPEHVAAGEIERWRQTPGVEVLGRVEDIAAFWAAAHIACLPSRGGEGLPRSLLEAAACARPIVTSDAPGCADFVTADTGVVVPREDVRALAAALLSLAGDAGLRKAMGEAGRRKVLAGYTEQHAGDVALAAWRRAMAP